MDMDMATVTINVAMKNFSKRCFWVVTKLRGSPSGNCYAVGSGGANRWSVPLTLAAVIAVLGSAFMTTQSTAQALPTEAPPVDNVAPITAWRVTPQLSVSETYTDNAALSPTALKSWVTESTTGLRIEKAGVRTKIYFDFRLNDFRYRNNAQLNNSQRLLTSYATVEAIDNWLFVDASANISQQNRSAFNIAGATTASGPNGNRVETATNQISPHVRGRLSDIAKYQVRLVEADIRANDATLPDTRDRRWTGFIKNTRVISSFGWSVDGDAVRFVNKVVGKLYDERLRGSLTYEIDSQLHVSAIAGREVTNFTGVQNDRANTSGVGLEWSPGARTQFAVVMEKRFFGNSHSLSFKHRTALSAWNFTSTRDVLTPSGQQNAAGMGTVSGLLSDLLVASIPDPVAREDAVRQRLENAGISANPASSGGFATGRPILVRADEASVAIRGVYNTITLSFTRRDQRGLGPSAGSTDSFSLSNDIRQQGVNLNWLYRLSPLSSISLVATSLRSEGLSLTGLDSNQRTLNLLFSTRVGQNTYATFGARRVHFDNSLNTGYRENAVLGSVSLRY